MSWLRGEFRKKNNKGGVGGKDQSFSKLKDRGGEGTPKKQKKKKRPKANYQYISKSEQPFFKVFFFFCIRSRCQ